MTDALHKALDVWAPTWPRRVTRSQQWADDAATATDELLRAQEDGESPFISVYSFPRGHTKNNNIPHIDTLFIDFDFEDGDYERGSGNEEAWRRDLSHLLVRVKMVAEVLDAENGWRAALSGHKGVHLFLDFPALPPDLGDFEHYVAGVNDYATSLIDDLSDETGIDDLQDYVDVTSSDLGRLCRVPNTLHEGATESFGESRFCVPVTIDELETLTPRKYKFFTSNPRFPEEVGRRPNDDVQEYIIKHILNAETSTASVSRGDSTVDWSRVADYREQSNDDIELEDVEWLTSNRPCIWRFHEREDKFRHGYQSHVMELASIIEMKRNNVPIDVMKEFLSNAPEYDEDYTERQIGHVISRDYKQFSAEKLLRKAPEFTGYDDCGLCQRVLAENPHLQ